MEACLRERGAGMEKRNAAAAECVPCFTEKDTLHSLPSFVLHGNQ